MPAPAPAPVTFGSGPDSLVIGLAEDAWQGDAQFTISIDGRHVAGPQTTIASHQTGQSQAFTVLGSWGAGPHTVGVSFTNDAWGGSASTDRNLYINSVSYDGVASPNGNRGKTPG